jgi:CRP/FNR family transcriptional regulator, cyclic AMP receptor protein
VTRELKDADPDLPLSQWLLPHVTKRHAKAGEMLFYKGEMADDMFYIESGSVRLIEINKILGPTSLIGEIGLFAPNNQRVLSICCETDCEFLTLNREGAYRLYYTNPALGFALMRLVVGRLIELNPPHPPRPREAPPASSGTTAN